mmetsp:Transcript_15111/g.48592  ORF Transcript_15111/g.48592 Transcript_15111/m.48592 type:complete len:246 (-) Transcript_15111:200-937(-)
MVLVVVEADDLDARVLLAQHWAEVLLDEGGHVVGRVDALLPADVSRLGLVLDRHAPDVDAARRVPREEAREVVRVRPLPRRVEAVWLRRPNHRLHAADRQLHPRWRRPGRRHQGEAVSRPALELRHRRVDHRDDAVVDVVLHRVVKVMQVRVARLLCERVGAVYASRPKVARPDRHPADGVAEPAVFGRCKVEPDDAPLVGGREALPVQRSRLGEGTAKAEDLLVTLAPLEKHMPLAVAQLGERL